MQREMRARLESLPRTQASFIEPMECLSVSELPEGDHWIWEVLCGGPHNAGNIVTRSLPLKAAPGFISTGICPA